jgi:hypothetical protein
MTVSAAGDYLLWISMSSGTSTFPTAITDSGSNTWTSLRGTLGNSNSILAIGGLNIAAFMCYAAGTVSGGTISSAIQGTPSTQLGFFADCGGIATVSAFDGGIAQSQSALGAGTNAASVAGGTSFGGNSDTVTAGDLIIACFHSSAAAPTSGTSPITFTQNARNTSSSNMLESGIAASTGQFDSCATTSNTGSVVSFQIALKAAIAAFARAQNLASMVSPSVACPF